MHKLVLAITGLTLVGFTPTFATTIYFDDGTTVCSFEDTSSLTTEYAGEGVTFSGPTSGSGGAILNQCSNFGIDAYSGVDFLAFNTSTYATGPETITFSSPVSDVSIFVGGTSAGPSYTMLAYDTSDTEIGSDGGTPGGGAWIELSIDASDISSLNISFSGYAVLDNLSWNGGGAAAVPEPATFGFCALAFVVVAVGRRLRGPAPL